MKGNFNFFSTCIPEKVSTYHTGSALLRNFERFEIAIIKQDFVKVINGLKFSLRRDLGRDEMRRHSHWTIVCSYLEHVAEVFERSTDVEMSQHVLIGT